MAELLEPYALNLVWEDQTSSRQPRKIRAETIFVFHSPFSSHEHQPQPFSSSYSHLLSLMEETKKSHQVGSEVASSDSDGPIFYDPSKESIWTRLGVNFESFKRAPGVTGYAALKSTLCISKQTRFYSYQ